MGAVYQCFSMQSFLCNQRFVCVLRGCWQTLPVFYLFHVYQWTHNKAECFCSCQTSIFGTDFVGNVISGHRIPFGLVFHQYLWWLWHKILNVKMSVIVVLKHCCAMYKGDLTWINFVWDVILNYSLCYAIVNFVQMYIEAVLCCFSSITWLLSAFLACWHLDWNPPPTVFLKMGSCVFQN